MSEPLPLPLPAGEAESLTLGVEQWVDVFLMLLAFEVEPGQHLAAMFPNGPGVVRRVRRSRLTTAVAAGDPFRCSLPEAFVLVLRPDMLEDVSQEEGRNA